MLPACFFSLLLLLTGLPWVWSEHYKGGTITWKPTNPNATGSPVEILISQKHSFTLVTRYACTQSTINNQLAYTDTAGTAAPDLRCKSPLASCTSSSFNVIQHAMLCTDFSTELDSSSGAYYEKQYLARTTNIDIAFTNSAWATVILMANNVSASWWYVGTHISLGLTTPINSSPGQYLLIYCM